VHWIGQISTQAKRAGDIVRGLGQFVRKSPVRRDEVDLNSLVHEVIDLLTVNSRMAQVPLMLDLAPSLPMVCVNGVQIQQVLVNLLLNATEAMESVDVLRRRMIIRTLPRGTEFVEIVVEDTGPGISPVQMQRLFEPYYTTKSGGMGMGLVISQSIIQAHDGDLWATSEEDAGTTFHFTLPVGTEEDTDELG
jgi:C4-dicarboxylate-specific signal transduction histidine kinase